MYADLKENFYCAMSSSIWMRWNFIKCSISHLIAWILIIITAISIIIPSLSLQKQIGSTQLGPGHANKCWVQQQGWHFSLAFWMCKYCTKCCVTTCGYFLAEKRLLWFQIEHFQLYWWACSNSRQIWGLFVQIHDAENPCCVVLSLSLPGTQFPSWVVFLSFECLRLLDTALLRGWKTWRERCTLQLL